MRHLHYLEIERFKRFGDRQHIVLDHPSVIIGPNNCGKTTVIQALALWSQAVRAWFETRKNSAAKERTGTPLNRLAIVAVPVQRTRFFWHDTQVRDGNKDIHLLITVGVLYKDGKVRELSMRFRNQGDELVYCSPAGDAASDLEFIEYAASLHIDLLYPMSGLDIEEPILQSGRIDALLGQGRTAEVLRNLCLAVSRSSQEDWKSIAELMHRLFRVKLQQPTETMRGTISLLYQQEDIKEPLDISSAGRGFLQMLLLFAYLYSHKNSVLLIDEPDAHLEILRQKQVYVLLRDIAHENNSQVVIVTHSEVILDEALDNNLTLLLEGKADDLAKKQDIRNALKTFGAEHYVKARECGHVLYVEGRTDVDMLSALSKHIKHSSAAILNDSKINTFYVQNNYAEKSKEAELERVEGGYETKPREHFNSLRGLLPNLQGLAILDNDGRNQRNKNDGNLQVLYWKRYEIENYFITPDVLKKYALTQYEKNGSMAISDVIEETLDSLIVENVFDGKSEDYNTWKSSPADAQQLIWEAQTKDKKLSHLSEIFFQDMAKKTGGVPLLRKGEFYQIVPYATLTKTAEEEVREKLDILEELLEKSREA
jgi:predicted ATPase